MSRPHLTAGAIRRRADRLETLAETSRDRVAPPAVTSVPSSTSFATPPRMPTSARPWPRERPAACAASPEIAARRLVDGGFVDRYDYALQTLTELRYDVWREFDPEDSLRFFALRLREVDMVKSTPKTIIAEGTDWRFLNELKRELKA